MIRVVCYTYDENDNRYQVGGLYDNSSQIKIQ